MSIVVQPNRTNEIRAFAAANPGLGPAQIARAKGVLASDAVKALSVVPKRRIKSIAR